MSKLTPKQAIFVAEYLIDGNATRAATAAGYAESSAHVTGAKLLKNAKVAAIIAMRQERLIAKLEITAEGVLSRLMRVADFDPARMLNKRGRVLPIGKMDDDTRAALIVEVDRGRVKIKHGDKLRALELLGRHHKLFTDKTEHSGSFTLEQLVHGAGSE